MTAFENIDIFRTQKFFFSTQLPTTVLLFSSLAEGEKEEEERRVIREA